VARAERPAAVGDGPAEGPFDDTCSACVGLCCVGLALGRSHDFPFDKPAGTPCRNLTADHRCVVHDDLLVGGYRGCVTYSCFGAGPLVTRAQAPATWRDGPAAAHRMFTAFHAVRALQELRWHVAAALAAPSLPADLREQLERAEEATVLLVLRSAPGPTAAPQGDTTADRNDTAAPSALAAHWDSVNALLRAASHALRGPDHGPDRAGAPLIGARMRGADLRRANLRGAALTAADLRRAQLQGADLTGADLRDTRLEGADLTGALFVTDAQLRSARGNGATRLPAGSARPAHWPR
jgi:hypothetical protein